MEDTPQTSTSNDRKNTDEDGTVLIYGFLVIKDQATGEILLSTRA